MAETSEAGILDQETEPEPESLETSEESESLDSTIEEGEEIEGEASEENEESTEEEVPEEEQRIGAPPFNQLKKEFPDIFKKYPAIQANFFKAEKYSEYFPTVEDAENAARKVEIFDTLDQHLTNGDFSPLVSLLNENNANALSRVADEILPLLQEKNPQLYVRAINPAFKHFITTGFATAEKFANAAEESTKEYGTNLKNAFKLITHFLYGPQGLPADAPVQQVREDPEKVRLQQDHQRLIVNSMVNFEGSTKDATKSELVKIIENNIDPDNKLTRFTREKVVETILNDVNTKISQDGAVQKQLQSLWMQAARLGFTDQSKAQLKRAFLSRAKMIIPTIRQRRLAEASGESVPVRGKTMIPQAGGSPRGKSVKVSSSEAKEKNMSEMDIINFGAK